MIDDQHKFEYEFNSHWFNSPGYLTCTVPECVKEEIQNLIKEIENGDVEVTDYRGKLAGHLGKETSLPIQPRLKYLVETMCYEYDKVFLNGKTAVHHMYTEKEFNSGWKYELKTLWINYAKKHDFNPTHNHSGLYSFVIWVQIPYDLNEELSVYPANGNQTSLFSFRYIDYLGEIVSHNLNISKSWEWEMALFPAKLHHGVNPFYTSDGTRISISGNIYSTLTNEN